MPRDPHDRPPDGLDPESQQWWQELAWLDDPEREEARRPPPVDRRFERAARRRTRRDRRLSRTGSGSQARTGRGSRSLVLFLAALVAAAGVVSFVERGWEQTREASFNEGGRLDDATVVEGDQGLYAFLATQPGSREPVTYEPCRTLQVEINPRGEVPGGSQLVLESMARVSELSGIELVYAGPSEARPDQWAEGLSGGTLRNPPPAVVTWSDEEETPGLAGDVVGLGGSVAVRGADQTRQRYITGSVTLDGPDLDEIARGDGGEAQVRAVILHEFGHLLGLGHVPDPEELMSESNQGQVDFGPGDREGLARLGQGDC